MGEGEALADTSGDVALEASPMANVAARSLSSKVDFDLFGGLTLAFFEPVIGLPARWVASDFRRLRRADSAS
jgi:hypothetical protein